MKSLVMLLSVFALNAQAGGGYLYECNCFPAKGEKRSVCDGQENLKLKISSTAKTIKTEMGDTEWEVADSFNSVLTSIPSPKNYRYYHTTSGGGTYSVRPDFLVENFLKAGGRKLNKCPKGGFVQALFDNGDDEVSTSNYVCCLAD